MTNEMWKEYNDAKICHIYMKPFEKDEKKDEKKNVEVRDHCHYTRFYCGAAHAQCNIMYKILSHIPIVSRYDAHLFIRELGKNLTNQIFQ